MYKVDQIWRTVLIKMCSENFKNIKASLKYSRLVFLKAMFQDDISR